MAATKHIVALSGGKDSTAMALRLAETEPNTDFEYIITPTGNELPDMVLHWKKLGLMLGKPLKPITRGKSIQGLIRDFNMLPNWRARWCTRILKIEPFEGYILGLMNQGFPVTAYVGLRADELPDERKGADYKFDVWQRFPLREWGWSIGEVYDYLEQRGVVIPERTDCAMCFFQTLAEWWRLWQFHPEQYAEAEEFERMTSHTLRSPSRDTWPTDLSGLRRTFEAGKEPKGVRQIRLFDSRPTMCSVCAR